MDGDGGADGDADGDSHGDKGNFMCSCIMHRYHKKVENTTRRKILY